VSLFGGTTGRCDGWGVAALKCTYVAADRTKTTDFPKRHPISGILSLDEGPPTKEGSAKGGKKCKDTAKPKRGGRANLTPATGRSEKRKGEGPEDSIISIKGSHQILTKIRS